MAAGGLVRIGLEIHDFGLQGDKFEKLVKTLAGLGRYPGHDCIPAPVFRLQAKFGKLAQNAVRVRAGLVHLVDSYDYGHIRGARMVDGFPCLLHHAVISRDNQDDQVGDLGAAGAHGRECLVAGCVKKDNFAALCPDMVGADMLGDAAGFATGDI